MFAAGDYATGSRNGICTPVNDHGVFHTAVIPPAFPLYFPSILGRRAEFRSVEDIEVFVSVLCCTELTLITQKRQV